MRKSIGSIITENRERKKLTREQLAHRVKVSKYYIAHLERNSPVRFSESLLERISKALQISSTPLKRLAPLHNRKASKYYSEYRRKQRVKAKRA